MGLGTFLAIMGIFGSAGKEFLSMYTTLLTMQEIFPEMWKIVAYVNHPTDVLKRKQANKYATPTLHRVFTVHQKTVAGSPNGSKAFQQFPGLPNGAEDPLSPSTGRGQILEDEIN